MLILLVVSHFALNLRHLLALVKSGLIEHSNIAAYSTAQVKVLSQ